MNHITSGWSGINEAKNELTNIQANDKGPGLGTLFSLFGGVVAGVLSLVSWAGFSFATSGLLSLTSGTGFSFAGGAWLLFSGLALLSARYVLKNPVWYLNINKEAINCWI